MTAAVLVPPPADTDQVEHLRIGGMHCAACADLVEALLRRQPGVRFARVSAASECAELRWQGTASTREQWLAALRSAGYDAAPAGAEDERAQRRREARQALWRLFVAGLCLSQVMMYTAPLYLTAPGEIEPALVHLLQWAAWLLTLPVLLFAASPFFQGAWRSLQARRIGMDVPVALGLALAFVASTAALFEPERWGGEIWFDSITMFVAFLLLARWLEMRLRHRSADALQSSQSAWPDSAQQLLADGSLRAVPSAQLQPGDRVRVAAGEAFPADGLLLSGPTQVSEAWLSGESRPLPRAAGDEVAAGSLNLGPPLEVQVLRAGSDTRAAAVLALMRQALSQRPATLRLADRVAAPFLWGVLLLAALAAAAWSFIDPSRALPVAVAVLIVTCPCALSLAGPSAYIAAAGALARRGLLLRRLDALEALAGADQLVFDKTGTLTEPRLVFAGLRPTALAGDESADALLQRAASLAQRSKHPVARAVAAACAQPAAVAWTHLHEEPGAGLQGRDAAGHLWQLGSSDWVLGTPAARDDRARAWLARDGLCMASIEVDEALRDDAAAAVQALAAEGLALSVLSGDAPSRVARVAARLGITQARGGATPHNKLQALATAQAQGHRVAMIGDGLNDAPVLARADVSISFAEASAVSRARADAVLLGTSLAVVAEARRHARRTMRVVRQNLGWAAAYNLACVPLALVGWLPPWAAGIGMAVSSLVVVLNSQRLRHVAPIPTKVST